jgi:hypothetical protein
MTNGTAKFESRNSSQVAMRSVQKRTLIYRSGQPGGLARPLARRLAEP